MNIRKHLLIAGVAAAPLLFTACCTAVDTPTAITEEQQKNIELDASLQDKLNFEYVRTWKTENKFTNVSVRARVKTYSTWNWIFCSYQDIPLAYRFVWYDKDGKEGGQSTWSHVTVDYGEEVGFASMSPNAQVAGYKLFIRPENADEANAPAEPPEETPVKTEETTPAKAGKVSADVKTKPTSVTPVAKSVSAEEAEADAASARQAKPEKK